MRVFARPPLLRLNRSFPVPFGGNESPFNQNPPACFPESGVTTTNSRTCGSRSIPLWMPLTYRS